MERLLFRVLGVLDPAHYLHNVYLCRELAGLNDFAPRRILDAGCGAGDHTLFLARRFPGADVLGVDLNGSRIQENQLAAKLLGIPNARFEVADLCAIQSESQFDFVVCIDVLEHIDNQTLALSNLVRAIEPGGMAFLHLPTTRERPVPFSRWLTGFHEWTDREHVAQERTWRDFPCLVEGSGLNVVKAYRTFGYFTGELATSLFALPYAPTKLNKVFLALLVLPTRILAHADRLNFDKVRYAVAVVAQKPS